jgi:hypothetical protein
MFILSCLSYLLVFGTLSVELDFLTPLQKLVIVNFGLNIQGKHELPIKKSSIGLESGVLQLLLYKLPMILLITARYFLIQLHALKLSKWLSNHLQYPLLAILLLCMYICCLFYINKCKFLTNLFVHYSLQNICRKI